MVPDPDRPTRPAPTREPARADPGRAVSGGWRGGVESYPLVAAEMHVGGEDEEGMDIARGRERFAAGSPRAWPVLPADRLVHHLGVERTGR